MKNFFLMTLFMHSFVLIAANAQDWSWLYTKKFTPIEMENNKKRSMVLLCKENIPAFTQMIFSWNAQRPLKGYFKFQAQVKDAKTQIWSSWHTMLEWGNKIQRTFLDKNTHTQYCHVRLEAHKNNFANGLRMKITAHDGADLSYMHSIVINCSHLKKFKETDTALVKNVPSFIINKVTPLSQMILEHPRAEHMCSPTSCSMLINYLNRTTMQPLQFAQNVYDLGLDTYGCWPFNIAHAYECCNGTVAFYVTRLTSFLDIYERLKKNIPVIVSVRGPLENAPREYKNGHLLVVIGWDKARQKVICCDPAHSTNESVLTSYSLNSFCKAWARSHHLAYIAEYVKSSH